MCRCLLIYTFFREPLLHLSIIRLLTFYILRACLCLMTWPSGNVSLIERTIERRPRVKWEVKGTQVLFSFFPLQLFFFPFLHLTLYIYFACRFLLCSLLLLRWSASDESRALFTFFLVPLKKTRAGATSSLAHYSQFLWQKMRGLECPLVSVSLVVEFADRNDDNKLNQNSYHNKCELALF